MPRQTHAIIDLEAIKANFLLAKERAPKSKTLAVIKANAYGHGSVQVAMALEPLVPAFAVAIFEEAVELREAGIKKPILVFQGGNDLQALEYAANHHIAVTIENAKQLHFILQSPLINNCTNKLEVWLKLDTGMHRLGFNHQQILQSYTELKACSWVNDKMVISSHFACASDCNNSMTEDQLGQFHQTYGLLNSKFNAELNDNNELKASIANSAAILGHPASSLDWNRPGIMLYGLSPFEHQHETDKLLQPAMSFLSEVIGIRELKTGDTVGYGSNWRAEKTTKIATVAAGYADGYPRHAANGTPLLIAGQKAQLAGRVSMDLITADITHCDAINIGDKVELWGKNVNANEVAHRAETIGYDLLTGITNRVPRIYS
jgi:alanine racemase